ncbi:pentapeptide repeat-containing protein [Salinispora arenicola]|uniref:pentapeptide repeat-containing protein n=1 Tax=Salinispora arenicola TaxID=168697 RepID=UPI0009B77CA0
MSGPYDAGLYRAKLTRADLTRADLRSADLTDAACGRLESLYRPWSNAAGGGRQRGRGRWTVSGPARSRT